MRLISKFVCAVRIAFVILSISIAQVAFTPAAFAESVVQDDVTISYSRMRVDRRSGNTLMTVTLTNTGSAPVTAPYQLEFSEISPASVTFQGFPADADGVVAFPQSDDLAPGASTSFTLTLVGLGRSRLTLQDVVTAEVTNTPPVADAGADQTAVIGTAVTLDGTGSSDADGQALTYAWTITTAPLGSSATLSDATAAQPSLTPDVVGTYEISLVVNDGTVDSDADTVTVSSENLAPVADAGADVSGQIGTLTTLSGAGSTDPNGDPITYAWAVTSVPAGSAVAGSGSAVTFGVTPDVAGSYEITLTVSDGIDSDSDTVTISVEVDEPPVADAGADAAVEVGAVAMLDGAGSSDPEGALVTYQWSLISIPAGSTAALDDATLVMPSFTADLPGTYVAQLIVSDGTQASAPATVTITTNNVAPVANAGPDQAIALGATATLDGTASSDVDGDPLTYSWSLLTVPAGSVTSLSDAAAPAPELVVDRPGDYVVQLVVSDGAAQSFDTVTISTLNSVPFADAGDDQSGPVGATITFDGSGSSDADGDALTYAWVLASRPAESTATLSGTDTDMASLTIDYPGTYVAQLIVNDGTINSALDTVSLTTINSRPVADAGTTDDTFVGLSAALSAAGSSDADFDPLTYSWALISAPAGSTAALASLDTQDTSIVPDLPGTYVAQLIVNDGEVDSTPATVAFDAAAPEALLTASPLRGAAPLDVTLSGAMNGGFGPFTFVWDNSVTADSFTRTFASPGDYEVSVTVTDTAGFSATATETITVLVAPTVDATATPDQGVAPLQVAFGAAAADADGTIVLYEWDFTDDGTYDFSDANSATASFTYTSAGLYTARLRVTDNDGLSTEATRIITVGEPPILNAALSPLTGTAPLDVTATATASDPDGEIARFEWDFNSDGVVDFTSADNGDTTYTFAEGGIYNATARVFDNDGLLAERSFVVSVAGPPTALPRAFPLSGEAPLTVTFFASGSDFDGSPEYYDWDYDGNGSRNIRLIASMNSTYTYNTPGTYQAALTVVDDDGLTDTKTVEIVVGDGLQADPLAVSARATPDNGGAPLDVTLIGAIERSTYSIANFGWDLDGDGTDDFTESQSGFQRLGQRLYLSSYADVDFGDVDGDGLMDMVVGSLYGEVNIYFNSGTATAPKYDVQESLWYETEQEIFFPCDPEFEDCSEFFCYDEFENLVPCDFIEGGEGGFEGGFELQSILREGDEVTTFNDDGPPPGEDEGPPPGEGTDPGTTNNEGPTTEIVEVRYDESGGYTSPRLIDLNGDGLLDLLIGNRNGTIRVMLNPGIPKDERQVWTYQEDLLADTNGTIDVGDYAKLSLFDRDGDGDLDILIGDTNGNLYWVTRSGTAAQPVWTFDPTAVTDSLAAVIDVGSRADPGFGDLDGDGTPELLIGNSSGTFTIYRNTGTSTVPVWTQSGFLTTSAGGNIDVGSYASAAFLDYSGDGLPELWTTNSSGTLSVYDLVPGDSADFFVNFDEIDVGSYSAPTFVNLDGDGDFDLIVGDNNGTLRMLINVGDATNPIFRIRPVFTTADGSALDVGSRAAPAVMDIDGDNDPDLIVGTSTGRLFVLQNTGTPTAPIFETQTPVAYNGSTSLIDVGSYAVPFAADVNGDGVKDLLVGNSSGYVYRILNEGTEAAPAWGSATTLNDEFGSRIDVGSYSAPVLFDADADGVGELYVGASSGVVFLYENKDPAGLTLRLEDDNVFSFDVGSRATPALGDLDADGDADVIIGNSSGLLYQGYTRGQLTVTFDQPGVYMPVFSATDTQGNTASAPVTVVVTATGSPTAQLLASDITGTVPLAVDFTYDGTDPDGVVTSFVLDADGDGTPEVTDTAKGTYQHVYTDAGLYTVTLVITDNNGNTATKTLEIDALPDITTSLTAANFSPVTGGTALINTSLVGASGLMTVDIIDGSGGLVRRLVDGLSRTPGEYQDAWDGRDDTGALVRDGAYYVIVSVDIDGRIISYDARVDANFEELTPSRSWSSTFNPYLGDPVEVGYQVPWPAEISLYFWTRDNNRVGSTIAPVRTVFLRLPRPSGSYVDFWDGFNDQGVAVDPGPQYPVTLWLYRLPPNAIIVEGSTPTITAIDLEPRLYNPVFNPYSPTGASTVKLTVGLDKPATISVDILNSEGLSVRRITADSRPSGPNDVTWDGRDSEGNLVAPGTYSLGVVAVDQNGNRSLSRYAATTVRY